MSIPTRALERFLCRVRRLAVLAVGSELRSDDAAGLLACREAARRLKAVGRNSRVRFFAGHTAPENLTGPIRRFGPSHLIVVDAVDFGRKPGAAGLVKDGKIFKSAVGTHQMPVSVMNAFFSQSLGCRTLTIGIQPKSLAAMGPLSVPVRAAARRLGQRLAGTIRAFVL